jgi:hypothetical protein
VLLGRPLALVLVVALGLGFGFGVTSPSVAAQGLGSAVLFGEIVSESGEPIPLVSVELRYRPTGLVVRAISNPEGRYLLANLRPGGPYDLFVERPGFASLERTGLNLEAEQRLRLDLVLREQALTLQGIDVEVDRRFEVSRAGPALTVDREAIRVQPSLARNALELAVRSPVVVQTASEGGLSITGQNERQNALLIDGALNQDVFGSSASGVPGAAARAKPLPLDAIQEFRVEAAPFDARTSGFTGGVLHAITRSGTNTWEGSAFSQFRNERLFSGLTFEGAEVAPETYRNHVWGFAAGGPIRPDVGHIFVAAEFEGLREPAPGYSLGRQEPIWARVDPDSVARMAGIFRNQYGVDPGSAEAVSLENPRANVFTRFDWQFGDAHTLTVRHNWAWAARDSTPNRASFGPYAFESGGVRLDASTHALSTRLVSRFGAGHSNELSINLQRTNEGAEPTSRFPQVDVRLASQIEGAGFVRQVRAGSRYFSQDRALDQDVVQLAQAVTLARDEIFTTLGVGLDYFRFRQRDQSGSLGYYRFNSVADLEANRPAYYEVLLPGEGWTGPDVRFAVAQPSLYVQQEHRLPDGLTLRYGVRWDIPLYPDTPPDNPLVSDNFRLNTSQFPAVKGFVSPRLGFNWQSSSTYRTQLRGGFGMFTGRLPFVWVANAWKYDGLRNRLLVCEGGAAPRFDPSPPLPERCAGSGTGAGARESGSVVAFSRNFRSPRELKLSLALDQQFPGGWVASLEGLWVSTHARTTLRNLNLPGPGIPEDAQHARAFGDRAHYGSPTPYGYQPKPRVDGLGPVIEIGWEDRSAIAYSVTGQLDRRFGETLWLSFSHTYSVSRDVQSLTQTDMLANLGATPIGFQASEYTPRPANFDRPHKSVATGRLRMPERVGGSEFSVIYVGQSGAPYSYVYAHDVNGDGFSGPGLPLDASNDLIHIPSTPTAVQGTLIARSLFAQLVSDVEAACLSEIRGAIAPRNLCRTPTTHQLDLRVLQPLPLRGLRVDLVADLLNVLNLIDRTWGRVWEVEPLVPILGIQTRAETGLDGPLPRSAPVLGYTGGVVRDAATGDVRPALPHQLIVPASQWQAQIGIRVAF